MSKTAAKAIEDLISEKDVMRITGYTREGLRYLRREGKVKWTSINGKKIIYFKSNLAEVLNLNVA